jgi:hypothetical protein
LAPALADPRAGFTHQFAGGIEQTGHVDQNAGRPAIAFHHERGVGPIAHARLEHVQEGISILGRVDEIVVVFAQAMEIMPRSTPTKQGSILYACCPWAVNVRPDDSAKRAQSVSPHYE